MVLSKAQREGIVIARFGALQLGLERVNTLKDIAKEFKVPVATVD